MALAIPSLAVECLTIIMVINLPHAIFTRLLIEKINILLNLLLLISGWGGSGGREGGGQSGGGLASFGVR